MKSKQMMVVLVAALSSVSAFANGYWGAHSGSWFAQSSWSWWREPALTSGAEWAWDTQAGPVDVTFDGVDSQASYLYIDGPSGATDNDGPFEKNVTFRGDGAMVTLGSATGVYNGYRRKTVFDNIQLVGAVNDAYFKAKGPITIRNGSIADFHRSGSTLDLSGGDVLLEASTGLFYTVTASKPSKLEVKDGARLDFKRSYSTRTAWDAIDVRVVDGMVLAHDDYIYNAGFFPERSGELVARNGRLGFSPTASSGDKWRLGGSASATGSVDSVFTVSENVDIYGRGCLAVGDLKVSDGKSVCLSLSKISLHRYLSEIANVDVTFNGDVEISVWGNGTGALEFDGRNHFRGGRVTFDLTERYGQAGAKHDLYVSNADADRRSGFVFAGAGTAYFTTSSSTQPNRVRSLCVDDGMSLVRRHAHYYQRYRVHDLTLGPNSTFIGQESFYNFLEATGCVVIDPTATIHCPIGAKSAGARPVPILAAIDGDFELPTISGVTASEGFSVHRVGGCVYWGDDKYVDADSGNRVWCGDADGLWGNSANWGNGVMPSSGGSAILSGFKNTVVTNLDADCQAYGITLRSKAGPFILRGEKIELFKTESPALDSESPFPFIVENELVSNQSELQVRAGCFDATDMSVIDIRGRLSVPNGTLKPSGELVVEGAVSAADLKFQKSVGVNDGGACGERDTSLRVRERGVVTVASQTSAQDVQANFWIDRGGEVVIEGPLQWNTATNDHAVFGRLCVTGAVGGNAVQGYFGTGLVEVGSLDGAAGGSVKIGEGVTLKTSGTCSMPVEVTSKATLACGNDLVLSAPITVSGLGAIVCISNEACLVVQGDVVGYDFDILKRGSGTLALNGAVSLARGHLTVESGTVAWGRAQTVGKLIAKPGVTLAFGSDAGKVSPLTLGESVNLEGVRIKAADEDAAMAATDFATILTVPEGALIVGQPKTDGGIKFRTVVNSDGSQSLQGKVRKGLCITVR